jgi:adenine-specific DNA-methyltransferase
LVGPNEHSHTAQSKLVPIIEDEGVITMAQLEEAFNIEKVTKEFFEKYRDLFDRTKVALDDLVGKDDKLRADFEEKFVKTTDFTKKLLGQIVFLYFLQKKGWFGVEQGKDWGTGSKRFMRDLFEGKIISYKNFFNDVLEHLFYDALARDRSDIDHFNPHFNCKIPFLNGGLFDPINGYSWEKTEINLPNDLFSNEYKDLKTGDVGNGILDIFDRYNFTVKEDEPLDREVAVDPEMLGKVFENLLEVKDRKSKGTYYTPREIVNYMCEQSLLNYLATELEGKVTKEDLEKLIKSGENVVEHETVSVFKEDKSEESKRYKRLLADSIKEFAKEIDEKLATIKVCDPAIGSGAFPVGMMNAIVKTRVVLSSYLKDHGRTLYTFKRDCIQNSLYGVDIDPGAVEIAKLRLWLSLVVDEDDIKQIKPLPNLDYKIMQGNSLLEEFEGIKLFDEKLLKTSVINASMFEADNQKILKLQSELLQTYYIKNPEWLRNKIADRPTEVRNLEKQLYELMKKKKKVANEDYEQKDLFSDVAPSSQIRDELKSLHKRFFNETSGMKKKDLKESIGKLEWDLIEATLKEQNKISSLKKIEEFKRSNTKPFFLWRLNFAEVFEEKGGFDVVIANPPYVGESGNKEIFRPIAMGNLGRFYQGKMDLFYFFFHLALDLGKPLSLCAFISTNYFITASGANKLRSDLRERAVINNLVNFNELRIFESALGQHNVVTIFSKDVNKEKLAHTCITRRSGVANGEILHEIFSGVDRDTDYYLVKQVQLYDGEENYIRLSGIGNMENPIEKVLQKMKEQGTILENVCEINQGLVTGANKVSLKHLNKYKFKAEVGDGIFVLSRDEIEKISEKEYLKPWYKNSDIARWFTQKTTNELVIYLDGSEQVDKIQSIIKHLEKYRDNLQERREVYKGSRNWYDLWRSRSKVIFEGEKIVAPYRSKTNTFGYNEIPWYAASDVYFLTQKDKQVSLKYILGLLNSKLYHLWLCQRGKRKGKILELFYQPLSEIPVKNISQNERKPFVDLVDKILQITKVGDYLESAEKQATVKDIEHQIDELVYKLYGLTEDEIKIVENS